MVSERIPTPTAVTLPIEETCVLVLDVTIREVLSGEDGQEYCGHLGDFLNRARALNVPVAFTAGLNELDEMIQPKLGRLDAEPVFHPDAYDKMRSTEMLQFIDDHHGKNLIMTGASANNAIMNTVTGAVRHFKYSVYVPLDGSFSARPYEFEYSMYQLGQLPGERPGAIFTTLGSISFVSPE